MSEFEHPYECNISIHAPREGRDEAAQDLTDQIDISIHAPREGRDIPLPFCGLRPLYFNPRAPRGARPQHSRDPNTH